MELSSHFEGQLPPLSLALDLDSLRVMIVQSKEADARSHLVQEYLLAANQLGQGVKDRAIASLKQSLDRGR